MNFEIGWIDWNQSKPENIKKILIKCQEKRDEAVREIEKAHDAYFDYRRHMVQKLDPDRTNRVEAILALDSDPTSRDLKKEFSNVCGFRYFLDRQVKLGEVALRAMDGGR